MVTLAQSFNANVALHIAVDIHHVRSRPRYVAHWLYSVTRLIFLGVILQPA
jgi:hypothetical protein